MTFVQKNAMIPKSNFISNEFNTTLAKVLTKSKTNTLKSKHTIVLSIEYLFQLCLHQSILKSKVFSNFLHRKMQTKLSE